MKEFLECFREQRRLHPFMQVEDAVKLCYQAAFGAAHLMRDKAAAWETLEEEYFCTLPDESVPLWEDIGGGYVRVNIAAWKAQGRGAGELFSLLQQGKALDITPFLLVAQSEWEDKAAFERFVSEWKERGFPPLHHSDIYREKENPAYRVVLKERIEALDK